MKTCLIPTDSPLWLTTALSTLQEGGLVAFPTDTVYGLAAMAFDGRAVKSIYPAKNRPIEKAIPVLIASALDLEKVVASVPEMALRLAARFWPGPLTIVLPRLASLPDIISNGPTVGVRVPNHAVARSLLAASGPLAVTSANISGQASPTTAAEVLAQLAGRIPLILDGGQTPGGIASTVVDCSGLEPKVLRAGPILEQELLRALGLA